MGLFRRVVLTRHLSIRVALAAVVATLLFVPQASQAVVGVDDYPSRLRNAVQDSLVDPWYFYNRECTSFVAWRLNHDAGVPFTNHYLGVHFGDAAIWKDAAVRSGVPVNSTPHVGAVAWWAKGSPGSSSGHVAYVMSRSSSSITIEEYNYLHRGGYDTRIISTSSSMWPSAFIHLGDLDMHHTSRPKIISGPAQIGDRLTATHGSWTPSGASYTYQWLAGGEPISGATHRHYTPHLAQLGKRLKVQVTASVPAVEPGTATSRATAAVAPGDLTMSAPPTVTGVAQVDSQLSATGGDWSPSATYAYQWNVDGAPVTGATKPTFTPRAAQRGRTVSVTVTATREGFNPASATSATTAAVAPATFKTVGTPTISGTAQVDRPLTAAPGTWSPTGTPSYQWLVAGVPVPGATQASFSPRPADAGRQVTVAVTMTRPGYTTTTGAASAATAAVLPGTFKRTAAPAVSGTPRVGKTLTASPGSWSPEPSVRYQWYADGVAVAGATSASFTPTDDQLAKAMTVKVTVSSPGYTTTSATSPATGEVAPGSITPTTAPAISGAPMVGDRLSTSTGTWSVPPSTVSYQWYADGTPLPGATEPTYAPTSEVLGQHLRVGVTVAADGYDPAATTSSRTAPVSLGRARFTSESTLVGTPKLRHTLTAQPGEHRPADASVSYHWLRAGHRIPGATDPTYRLTRDDVGKRVAVRLSLTAADWRSSSTHAGPTRRVRSVPRVSTVSHVAGHRVRLRFSVVAPGLSDPHGILRVTDGDQLLGRISVVDGHAHLRVHHLHSGGHRLRLRYHGHLQAWVTRHARFRVP